MAVKCAFKSLLIQEINMFVMQKENVVWWPATINVPADNGKTIPHEVSFQLKIIPTDKFRNLMVQGDVKLLSEVVLGWRDVMQPDNTPLPFNDENKTAFFNVSFIAQAIVDSYNEAASGSAATKN